MQAFANRLAEVLEREKLTQASFAKGAGLQATYLNRLLKTGRAMNPITAMRITEAVPAKHRAALVAAFLEGELSELEAVRKNAAKATSESYLGLVRVTLATRDEPPRFPSRLQEQLRRYARLSEDNPTLLRALEAFLEAMSRTH